VTGRHFKMQFSGRGLPYELTLSVDSA